MAATKPTYLPQPEAERELRSYLFEIRYGRKTVPTKVDPDFVEKFLRREMTRQRSPLSFSRARRTVDYYDRRSAVQHFVDLLKKQEKDEKEFRQSCRCISIAAESGDDAHAKSANDYFAYLVAHPLAAENYDDLLETLQALNEQAESKGLENRLGREIKALEPRAKTDPQADDTLQRLDQYLNNDLPGVVAANRQRFDILKLTSPDRRMDQLCRLYVGWTLDNTEELEWWSARCIRREARAGHRGLITDAFRKIVSEVDADKMPKEEKDLYRVRCFRAMVFLSESLTPQEKRTLDKAEPNQIDVLYREP